VLSSAIRSDRLPQVTGRITALMSTVMNLPSRGALSLSIFRRNSLEMVKPLDKYELSRGTTGRGKFDAIA
jgi:hypothetical protein